MMLAPLSLPGTVGRIAHPVAAGLCFVAASAVFFSFMQAYRVANGSGPPPGEKPAWHGGMTLRLLVTAGLWAVGLWVSSLP